MAVVPRKQPRGDGPARPLSFALSPSLLESYAYLRNSFLSCPSPVRSTAKPLSVLLGGLFNDAFARQGFASRELATRWAEIAGPEIAAHSEPIKIQWPRPIEGQPPEPATLVLRVEGPVALEIQHASDIILERVNRFFGWNAVGRTGCRGRRRCRKPGPQAAAGAGPGGSQRWPKRSLPSRTRAVQRTAAGAARRRQSAKLTVRCSRLLQGTWHCHNRGFKLANPDPWRRWDADAGASGR